MFEVHNSEKSKCIDFVKRHKKVMGKTVSVRIYIIGDLADEIKRIVSSFILVNRDDILCFICITFYKKKFFELENKSEYVPISDEPLLPPMNETVGTLNVSIKTFDAYTGCPINIGTNLKGR